eukprot:m.203699 g.203699  ORF g.203699 m.203699 type:complete len:240 (+) comp22211_c0_seq1:123-842(+)
MSEAVARILASTNARSTLGLPDPGSGNDGKLLQRSVLRRAYHALCRAVHPDKCDDPRAGQAFHRLSAAFDELLDQCPDADTHGNQCRSDSHQTSSWNGQSAGANGHGPAGDGTTPPKPPGVTQGDWKWRRAASQPASTAGAATKWWEQRSFVEIERLLRMQEAELEREIESSVRQRQKRTAVKTSQRQRNNSRVSAGLDSLRRKYHLPSTTRRASKRSPAPPSTARRRSLIGKPIISKP